jgi:amino acid transporter
MFERFKSNDRAREGGGVATAERRDRADGHAEAGLGAREVRARQRDEYGGINWGAAFFGWLVAVGMGAILTGIVSAAGAAIGFSEGISGSQAETVSFVGAILLLVVLAIAYYCGGYVSGRMSRFDGGRQGVGAWLVGLVITILLGVAGAIAGSEYNVLAKFDAPRLPIDEGDLATGGLITLIAILVVSLLAAMAGGKAGERYHKKVDRTGFGV